MVLDDGFFRTLRARRAMERLKDAELDHIVKAEYARRGLALPSNSEVEHPPGEEDE